MTLSCLEDMSLLEHQEIANIHIIWWRSSASGIARAIAMKSKIITS